MRKFKRESELKHIAMTEAKKDIVVVVNDNKEETRKPNKAQQDMIYSVFYGALLGLNWGEAVRGGRTETQAIIDSHEFTYDILMNSLLKENERVQGYVSFYCRIKEIVRNWEEE